MHNNKKSDNKVQLKKPAAKADGNAEFEQRSASRLVVPFGAVAFLARLPILDGRAEAALRAPLRLFFAKELAAHDPARTHARTHARMHARTHRLDAQAKCNLSADGVWPRCASPTCPRSERFLYGRGKPIVSYHRACSHSEVTNPERHSSRSLS